MGLQMSLLTIFCCINWRFLSKFNKCTVFQKLKGKFSISQARFCQNSSKILSKLKQNPQKLNLPDVAAKTTKKMPVLDNMFDAFDEKEDFK